MNEEPEQPQTQPSKNRFSPESISWGFGGVVAVIAAAFVTNLVVLMIIAVAFSSNGEDLLNDVPFMWILLGTAISFAVPAIAFARWKEGSFLAALRALGLRKVSPLRAVGTALLLVVALYLVEGLIFFLLQDGQLEQSVTDEIKQEANILTFIGVCLLIPFAEEILFRGFIFAGIRSKLSFIPAATISSLLFALGHMEGTASNAIGLLVATFLTGMALSWAYERTGSLWTPILLHSFVNTIALSLTVA